MVIFNLLGLGMALLGVAAMAAIGGGLNSPALGFIALGLAAGGADMMYRRSRKEPATSVPHLIHPKSGGHVFFVPIWIWAVLAMGIGVLGGVVIKPDPRAAKLDADEKLLSATPKDASAAKILELLRAIATKEAKADNMTACARVDGNKVLILVGASNLRKFKDEGKRELAEVIAAAGEAAFPGKEVYVGVKGLVNYGVISTPKTRVKVCSETAPSELLEFYGPKPTEDKAEGSSTAAKPS
ncbi:MAG TPA: hypothetical protein VEJ63_16165 [Planctomycetota bacterium]|nr:hypothetical protein [Planctomycetota bacterium]